MPEKDSEHKEPKKKRQISKQSSQLVEVPLQGFTATEFNFFEVLCYKVQNQGVAKVWIDFNEFRELAGYKRRGDEKLLKDLKAVSDKFSRINLMENRENGFKIIVPFIDFEADTESKRFAVGVHPEFAKALNDLDGTPGKTYVLEDVFAITHIAKSVYTKHCLKMLYAYRKKGGGTDHWYTTVSDLKYYLDIPQNYTTGNISQKVLSKIEEDIEGSDLFKEFEITPRKDNKRRSSGRKGIDGYIFSFKFKEDLPTRAGKENSNVGMNCPQCGRPLVRIKRRDGTGYFFGHSDGWKEDAKCRYTTNDIDEAKKKPAVDGSSVTRNDLESYYRYLRDKAFEDSIDRRDYIKDHEPDIWELYEQRERLFNDSVKYGGAFTLSDESREKKRTLLEKIKTLASETEELLEKKGYGKDYMTPHYKCSLCRDTGQKDDGQFCSCRKERAEEAKRWLQEKEKQG